MSENVSVNFARAQGTGNKLATPQPEERWKSGGGGRIRVPKVENHENFKSHQTVSARPCDVPACPRGRKRAGNPFFSLRSALHVRKVSPESAGMAVRLSDMRGDTCNWPRPTPNSMIFCIKNHLYILAVFHVAMVLKRLSI